MCRITGFIDTRSQSYDKKEILLSMRDTLAHGGPDDAGHYIDAHIALGHRRLSILDLSKAGHQPMEWQQSVIVYNGEIYNFKAVRTQLEKTGYTFKTDTDTEVILKAFHEWGTEAVHRFRGMFAFAIWDREKKKLALYRDRLGVKPLYYYHHNGLFLFASELKAFHQHPYFDKTINHNAVALFLQQGYIHAPHSIFRYVKKLEPGCSLQLQWNHIDLQVTQQRYWSAKEVLQRPLWQEPENELSEKLEDLLTDSFELRMVSDVPVGIFLSGGIDSSLVTALLAKKAVQPLQTFTIGFEDPAYNEAGHARAVANHLGTNHTEILCTENEFQDILQWYPQLYDEPFGDSSGIPTHLVARLAKKEVKVSLSADGGDELFGGYTKYEITKNLFAKAQRIPAKVRKPIAQLASTIDPQKLENTVGSWPILNRYTNIANKFHKARQAIAADNVQTFFNLASTYAEPADIERLTGTFMERFPADESHIPADRLLSYLGYIDICTYLEGDILCKVDRATMHTALEGRDPFLDHHIVEFALRLPDHLKMQGTTTKYLLRKILYNYVPQQLIERPKQGFAIPIGNWLRTFLKEELVALTQDAPFQQTFRLNQALLHRQIQHFLSKKRYVNEYQVWFVYVLYQWYRQWLRL